MKFARIITALGMVASLGATAAQAQYYDGNRYDRSNEDRRYDDRRYENLSYEGRGFEGRGYDARRYDNGRYDDRRYDNGGGYRSGRGHHYGWQRNGRGCRIEYRHHRQVTVCYR